MTLPTQAVLRALLEDPTKERYGLELCHLTGLPAGTIYPILTRLEVQHGWLDCWWEEPDAANPSRPRRRYVRLTEDGAQAARLALAAASVSKTAARLRPVLDQDGRWAW
jgi:DNA-binding PadR family transcriptional regulator